MKWKWNWSWLKRFTDWAALVRDADEACIAVKKSSSAMPTVPYNQGRMYFIRRAVGKTFSVNSRPVMGDDADWISWAVRGERYYRCGSYWLPGSPSIMSYIRFLEERFRSECESLKDTQEVERAVNNRTYQEAVGEHLTSPSISLSRGVYNEHPLGNLDSFCLEFAIEFTKNYTELSDESN